MPKFIVPGLALLVVLGCAKADAPRPYEADIPATLPLPIDGVWTLKENGAQYRFERGRFYAIHDYDDVFTMVRKGQVIAQGLQQDGARRFSGFEAGWKVPWSAVLEDDRSLTVHVSTLIPFTGHMRPVKLDYPDWLTAQLSAGSIVPAPSGLARPKPRQVVPPLAVIETPALRPGSLEGLDLGQYHALVIGNNRYRHLPKLRSAHEDARAVVALLADRYGFETQLLLDATRSQILVALSDYRGSLARSDNLLVYYAGHGWLDEAADEGYWLPIDATRDNEVNWIANSAISASFKAIPAKHILVVADSCYSGKLTRGLTIRDRSSDYVAQMVAKRSRMVIASGGLEPVLDSGGGKHSVFAAAFLDALRKNTGVVDATTLFAQLRRQVMIRADQTPEFSDIRKAGHEGGDFLFVPTAGHH